MTPSRDPLGHLELDVLQYVSDHHPISVREVATHFAETSGQARTTVHSRRHDHHVAGQGMAGIEMAIAQVNAASTIDFADGENAGILQHGKTVAREQPCDFLPFA